MCALTMTAFSQTNSETIDLTKYSGKWYIIACIPTSFDKKWENVTETYTLNGSKKIDIYTTYNVQNDPKEKDVRSKGFVKSKNNAFWRVQFVWPFRADYLIEEIGTDYSYAIAGGRKHTYFYILSRTPEMDPKLYENIITRYEQVGYDMKKLRKINHTK